MPDPLSSLLGAVPVVGGVISGMINNANTDSVNQSNQRFALQQQTNQNYYNQQMWNQQNAYNSPSATMKRFTDAGLNPNLIYGGATGGGGMAAPIQPSARAEFTAIPHQPINGSEIGSSAIAAFNSSRLAGAQVDNTQAQIDLAHAQAEKNLTDAMVSRSSLPATLDNLRTSTNLNAVRSNVESSMAPFQQSALKAQAASSNSLADLNLSKTETENVMRAPTLAAAVQSVVNMRTSNMRDSASIAQIMADTQAVLNDATLKHMDINMRNSGSLPTDGVFYRSLGSLLNKIFGTSSSAAGADY